MVFQNVWEPWGIGTIDFLIISKICFRQVLRLPQRMLLEGGIDRNIT